MPKTGPIHLKASVEEVAKAFQELGKAFSNGCISTNTYANALREKEMINEFTGMNGYAYLPAGKGQLIRVDCTVVEIQHEVMNHYSARYGPRVQDDSFIASTNVHLSCVGPGELVKDTFSGSIEDYSVMELLTEVEKRTKDKDLMIS